VVQCGAVCCSMLQRVYATVCWQCIVVCCSVLQQCAYASIESARKALFPAFSANNAALLQLIIMNHIIDT